MSIRIDASGEGVFRRASLPTSTNFTVSCWVKVVTDRTANHRYIINLENTTSPTDSTAYLGLGWDTTNGFVMYANGIPSTYFASNPSTSNWFWCALTCSGTGAGSLVGYFRDIGGATVSASMAGTSFTTAQLGLMNDTYDEWVNGDIAAIKVWDAVLTQAELEAEIYSYMPRRTANLHLVAPGLYHTDLVDYSGNAKTLTADGTLSTEDGPPIAWFSGVPDTQSSAAVASLVSASDSGTAFVSQPTYVTTLDLTTFTVTAGVDVVLFAGGSWGANAGTLPTNITATWDNGGTNQAMTSITSVNSSTADTKVQLWYLVNPTPGNKTLRFTWTTTCAATVGAAAFAGVDQLTPYVTADTVTNTGTSTTPSSGAITSATSDATFAIAGATDTSTGARSFSASGETQTSEWRAGTSTESASAATSALGGTSNTHAFTINVSDAWAAIGIHIKNGGTFEQEGYRFRLDNGSETGATWSAHQDTATATPVSTNFRLRFLLNRQN